LTYESLRKLERLNAYLEELQTWTFQVINLLYELNYKVNAVSGNGKLSAVSVQGLEISEINQNDDIESAL
jgi:capsid portal protein